MRKIFSLIDIENILHHLNYRWNLQALALWKGEPPPFAAYQIYEDCDDFLTPETLEYIEAVKKVPDKIRLRHALIDHYLQKKLLPYELEIQTWMRGASANVEGEKIRFQEIIPWCQGATTCEKRRILQKETRALCKFLKPLVLNRWELLLKIIHDELGFKNYQDYCTQKKGLDYELYYHKIKKFLQKTDDLYFPVMERWAMERFKRPLDKLTRFDAIKLLSLEEFNIFFPKRSFLELTDFFQYWEINLNEIPGLYLELGNAKDKSAQALTIFLEIPCEIYILMRPQGGWIDLETLWHELGHGFSAVFTSPESSSVERNMNTCFSLSESYAFLLQNMIFSSPFLKEYMGLTPRNSKKLRYYKVLRDLSVFRRYGAKFLTEFEMFSNGNLSDGTLYAENMRRYTGFYYQPESHLFDLVPEFYCLDYLLGWMGETLMEEHFRNKMGNKWMFRAETGQILKKWWHQGNQYDIFHFFKRNGLGKLCSDSIWKRWETVLNP